MIYGTEQCSLEVKADLTLACLLYGSLAQWQSSRLLPGRRDFDYLRTHQIYNSYESDNQMKEKSKPCTACLMESIGDGPQGGHTCPENIRGKIQR